MMLSERLRALRKEKGLLQDQLAKEIDVGYSSYKNYELGTRMPPAQVLERLANFYDVTLDYLLGKSPYRTPKEIHESINALTLMSNTMSLMRDPIRLTEFLPALVNVLGPAVPPRLWECDDVESCTLDLFDSIIIMLESATGDLLRIEAGTDMEAAFALLNHEERLADVQNKVAALSCAIHTEFAYFVKDEDLSKRLRREKT